MLALPGQPNKTLREVAKWGITLVFAATILAAFASAYRSLALVQPNGRLYYGDDSTTVKFRANSHPFTFNTEQTFTHGASSSLIAHTVVKTAPTRDEVMVGNLKVDGQLMVVRGVNGYDTNTDYSLAWTNTGTTPAQTCNSTTEADCTRAFDIAYERLSGRAMVVYADNVNQKLYYCYFDGTSWGPVSTCAPTNGSNDISLSSNGRPIFVSMKSKAGSNELIMATGIDASGTHEAEAFRWDGDSWEDAVLLSDASNLPTLPLNTGNAVDVDWETSSGDALAVFGRSSAGATRYKLLPSGGSWGSEQTGPALGGGSGQVVTMNIEADPSSDRVLFASSDTTNDGNFGIWKADGSTQGWTMGNEDTTLETEDGIQYVDAQWQKTGSVALWANQTGTGNVVTSYQTATCTGSGCSFSSIATFPDNGGDDGTFIRLAPSPNSNDIMAIWSHIDRDLYAQHWDGSTWEGSASASLETSLSPGTTDNTFFHGMSAAFTYVPYTPWARNWRFYSGTDTTNTPTTALANENTAITGFDAASGTFRLRYSTIELTGMGQTDSRKRLRYASDNGGTCTPNTVENDPDCIWIAVDDIGGGGIWRYVDCNGGSSVCNDGVTLSGTVLSGSPTAGWWTTDKDDTGTSDDNMDHNALQLRELEYSVQANGASPSTTYYFRMYDVDQDRPVRREQDNDGSNDCASAPCTYPTLTTATPPGPTVDQVMRHGSWFSGGSEQRFFWAD